MVRFLLVQHRVRGRQQVVAHFRLVIPDYSDDEVSKSNGMGYEYVWCAMGGTAARDGGGEEEEGHNG